VKEEEEEEEEEEEKERVKESLMPERSLLNDDAHAYGHQDTPQQLQRPQALMRLACVNNEPCTAL
jgi:hypothetical protein